jgi:hypothetical protein
MGGCTGQARVARLGHAPERAIHHTMRELSRCAVESADSLDDKKTSAEENDYDSGLGMVAMCNTRILLP